MANDLDIAAIDGHLERLLDLAPAERESTLLDMEQTEPDLAAVLRRVLRIAGIADTLEFRAAGESIRVVAEDAPPPQIEGYRLTGEIGRGGMATVYSAVRDVHGAEQTVAIKVLRAALLSPLDRERFMTEQRILARLQHPNIATLLDVGVVDERPYMVLEHIDGQSIERSLQARIQDLPAILDAVDKVCAALEFAHQHLVIHRDVKPDNVLIDRDGQIKLIDFGIAKILDDGAGLRASPTVTGSAPLTLRYASPEQLTGKPVGIASDVYQVGLLLYQLTTAAWPFAERDRDLPHERLRDDVLPILASRRATEPKLARALRGDIDSILLKCLQRDPGQRYATVAALREDLQRHRSHRPVQARRHTRGYVLRSFLVRHKLGVTLSAAAIVLSTILIATAFMLTARARDYAGRTERILDTVTELFSNASPFAEDARNVTVVQVVGKTAERFLTTEDADPLFQVQMLERLAEMQRGFWDYELETKLLQRAWEISVEAKLERSLQSTILVQLADSFLRRGDYAELDRLLEAAKPVLCGIDVAKMHYVRTKMLIERQDFERAEEVFVELFAAMKVQEAPRSFSMMVQNSYGNLQRNLGNYETARQAYQSAIGLLDQTKISDQEALFVLRANVARALGDAGRYQESDREYVALLSLASDRLGDGHPMVSAIVGYYAILLFRTSRYDTAYSLLQRYLPTSQASDNLPLHADFLDSYSQAALYVGEDRQALDAAVKFMELKLDLYEGDAKALEEALEAYAMVLFELGVVAPAADLSSEVLRHKKASPRYHTILRIASGLGLGQENIGESDVDPNSCDGAEERAFWARLVMRRAPDIQTVPADCSRMRSDRLVAMGLLAPATKKNADFPVELLQSPFARVATEPGSWPLSVEPEMLARIASLNARIEESLVSSLHP